MIGEFFVDYDEGSGCFGLFHTESDDEYCFALYTTEEEALEVLDTIRDL